MAIVKEEHLLDLLAHCYGVIREKAPEKKPLINVLKFVLHVSGRHDMCPTTGAGIISATSTETTTSDKTFVPGIGFVHAPAKEADHA